MDPIHAHRSDCRLCGSTTLDLVVPITPTPVADAFVPESARHEEQRRYPLDLYQCRGCGHVQLLDIVPPEVLFRQYSYFSGRSPGLVKHFGEYADRVIAENVIAPGSLVVDVGSNDGTFLRFFQHRGMRVLGIDPAENIATQANAAGIETLPVFLDDAVAGEISVRFGKAKIVAANNVFAHSDDMLGMARSIQSMLDDDGVFVFEVSYLLDVIDGMLLGTIFHEHVCYHSVTPLVAFLERAGMQLIRVQRVGIQGGSLICTAQRSGGGREVDASVGELLALERERRLHDPEMLKAFSARIEAVGDEVRALVKTLRGETDSIAAFGAARGGTLLVYHFGLGPAIQFIVDDSPEKQGLLSPGYHIPVLPTSALYERVPKYVFILAWVHSRSIMENHRRYLEEGGTFVTCFPEIEIVSAAGRRRIL